MDSGPGSKSPDVVLRVKLFSLGETDPFIRAAESWMYFWKAK